MPIRFACPRCDKTLKVDDRFAGRRAKCPNCREPIEIPEESQKPVRTSVSAGEAVADSPAGEGISQSPPGAPEPEEETSRPADSVEPSFAGAFAPAAASNGVVEEPAAPVEESPEAEPAPPDASAPAVVSSPSVAQETTPGPPPFEALAPREERPLPPKPPAQVAPPVEDDDPFASPFEVYDDDAEIVYAEGTASEESERFLVSRTRLAIPRVYVYLQGALLVVVALLSFVIGWAFGGSGARYGADAPRGPVVLSGVVRVEGYEGPIAASEGALVAILPADRKPAEKIPVDGLRPEEIGRIVPPRTLGAVRELGGVLAISDSRGEFRAELSPPGEYRVLVVLPDVYRPSTSDIALDDLATLGDYFLLPDQLVGQCRYSLTTERVDESKSIVVRFP